MYINLERYFLANNLCHERIFSSLQVPKENQSCVMLTGSLATGHGTTTSDLDVHVLIEKEHYNKMLSKVRWKIKDQLIDIVEIDGEVLDIEYICLEEIITILDLIDKKFNDNLDKKFLVESISKKYDITEFITLIHRLYTGHVITGIEVGNELKSRIDNSKYFAWKTRYLMELCELLYQDLIGFIEVKDTMSVKYFAKTLFSKVLYAYLTSKKISMDREKWLIVNLKRLNSNNKNIKHAIDILVQDVANNEGEGYGDIYTNLYEEIYCEIERHVEI